MKLFKIIGGLFFLIGIAALVGVGYGIADTKKFIARSELTKGEVVDIVTRTNRDSDGNRSSSRYKVVRFKDKNGYDVEFESTSSTSGGIRIGEPIEVRYDSQNSSHAHIASSFMDMWGDSLVFLILGVIFSGLGFPLFWLGIRDDLREKWARDNGREVQAEITGAVRNTSMSVNGRYPWQVMAQWQNPETHEVHLFRSRNLWYDPSDFLPKQVFVKYDPVKPKRYWMDISFLPKKA